MLYFIIAILVGVAYGFVQSMIMSKSGDYANNQFDEGIRGHVLFPFYHFIFGIFCFVFIIFTIMTWEKKPDNILLIPQYISMITGMLFISWTCSEFTYPFIRWGKWTRLNGSAYQLYEHLVLFDFYSKRLIGKQVIYAHFVRIILGITFLMIGGV